MHRKFKGIFNVNWEKGWSYRICKKIASRISLTCSIADWMNSDAARNVTYKFLSPSSPSYVTFLQLTSGLLLNWRKNNNESIIWSVTVTVWKNTKYQYHKTVIGIILKFFVKSSYLHDNIMIEYYYQIHGNVAKKLLGSIRKLRSARSIFKKFREIKIYFWTR